MKLYQYDNETGVYEGEIFEESDNIQYNEGVTTVAPPLYEAGHVPVFDLSRKGWEILPIGTVRQLMRLKSERTKQ